MELLLDTHAFLWWVDGTRRLPRAARAAIADPANDCRVSLVSCWEMVIKLSLGKLRLPAPIEDRVVGPGCRQQNAEHPIDRPRGSDRRDVAAEHEARHRRGQPRQDVHQAHHAPAVDLLDERTGEVERVHVEEQVEQLVKHGYLGRMTQPRGVTLVKPPESTSISEILDAVREVNASEVLIPSAESDPVGNALRRRDQAVEQALAGLTLQSLAVGSQGEADRVRVTATRSA